MNESDPCSDVHYLGSSENKTLFCVWCSSLSFNYSLLCFILFCVLVFISLLQLFSSFGFDA